MNIRNSHLNRKLKFSGGLESPYSITLTQLGSSQLRSVHGMVKFGNFVTSLKRKLQSMIPKLMEDLKMINLINHHESQHNFQGSSIILVIFLELLILSILIIRYTYYILELPSHQNQI